MKFTPLITVQAHKLAVFYTTNDSISLMRFAVKRMLPMDDKDLSCLH
jgi:hypothetical protein